MPLGLFRLRNVATANVVGVLWAAAMFAWFFISALYLQLVLGYSPLQVGLAFLPANLIMGAFSLGLSAKLVHPLRHQDAAGDGAAARRRRPRALRARAVDGSFAVDVLPSMILLGCGAGMAFNPVLLAAMSDVAPEEAGLASGVVNTSFMMGGALGLAVLASLAASRTRHPARVGRGTARGPQRRLSRRVPRGCAVRPGSGSRGSRVPAAGARGRARGRRAARRRTGDRGGGVSSQSVRVAASHELTAAAIAPVSVLRL